ncbi:MAG: ankyrin repeat domain-containing protein [Alphaproteobacteria bacterium]|nr:ankyrin repeat domain-containing protein [Alphaproteobacteria bacterium]
MEKGIKHLMLALYKGDLELAKELIRSGVNVNDKDDQGKMPLDWAVQESNVHAVEMLINAGANVNFVNDDERPLIVVAANKRNEKIVQMLIDGGAEVDAVDEMYGFTALRFAAYYGDDKILKILFNAGADPNIADYTDRLPVLWAAKKGHPGTADLLKSYQEHFSSDSSEDSDSSGDDVQDKELDESDLEGHQYGENDHHTDEL